MVFKMRILSMLMFGNSVYWQTHNIEFDAEWSSFASVKIIQLLTCMSNVIFMLFVLTLTHNNQSYNSIQCSSLEANPQCYTYIHPKLIQTIP